MKKHTQKPDYSFLSNIRFTLGKVTKSEPSLRWIIPCLALLAPVTAYIWTLVTKTIIDMVISGADKSALLPVAAALCAVQLSAGLLSMYLNKRLDDDFYIIAARIETEFHTKCMLMDYALLEDSRNLDLMDRAHKATNRWFGVCEMFNMTMRMLTCLTTAVAGCVLLGNINLWLIAITALLAVMEFIVNDRTTVIVKEVDDESRRHYRRERYLERVITDHSFGKDIRMFAIAPMLYEKCAAVFGHTRRSESKSNGIWFKSGLISNILWLLGQCALYGYLIRSVLNTGITPGEFSLYITVTATFSRYLTDTLEYIGGMRAKALEVMDLRRFTDSNFGNEDAGEPVPKADKYVFVFDHVSFRYPGSDEYALKDVCITVKHCEKLGIVGLNGAGKSTFIKLLLRLYEPTEGRILLNGTDIRTFRKKDYYRLFAPVFQEINVFAFTVGENVSMNEADTIDRERANACIAGAGLDDKISSLKSGLDTPMLKYLTNDGIELSGGQNQKLAYARALYKDAPVLVLDEATSAMDAFAADKLYRSLAEETLNKTAIFISHRMTSVTYCDTIAVFENGRISEYGTYNELMSRGGAFARMFGTQASYYTDSAEKEASAV